MIGFYVPASRKSSYFTATKDMESVRDPIRDTITAMGRIIASVTVHNARDLEKGLRCDALVHTGASYLVLPTAWKDRLGDLETVRNVQCETATQELVAAEVCGPVKIQTSVQGRRRRSSKKLRA